MIKTSYILPKKILFNLVHFLITDPAEFEKILEKNVI